jgi:hypothetical protein
MQKHRTRAFGLSLMAVVGLMAFGAVGAQAETLSDGGKAGKFAVGGLTTLAKPGVGLTAASVGTVTFLIPARGFDILCKKGVIEAEFKSESEALGSAEFTECSTWVNVALGLEHKESVPCTVAEPIEIEKMRILPKKHESAPYVLFEEDGAAFTTLKLSGEACPLPPSNKKTGSFVGKVINNSTAEPSIEFSEEIQKLFQVGEKGDHLKYGTFEEYIDATFKAKLTDAAHKGMTIAVI